MMPSITPKTYIRVPKRVELSVSDRILRRLAGLTLGPLYLILGAIRGVPGVRFRFSCIGLGTKLLLFPADHRKSTQAMGLILDPMDSTRYFEFNYAARALHAGSSRRHLDVSSPRLVPLMLARKRSSMEIEMINPDARDLEQTRELIDAMGLTPRCHTHGCRISDAAFERESFDSITCISVLEHIPEDIDALRTMWTLLRRGGSMVLTLPCMASASEQYIDHNEYGVLPSEPGAFVFWQRFYDGALLREHVFSVIGEPSSYAVYGEKKAGSFLANAEQKRKGAYPFWREPYMMAKDYRHFGSVDDLPGEGVIGMTFVKK
jgi:SAM-dependent methyltransferase